MSNTYRINFRELRQENLKDIFAAFERALQKLNIDFYLIGAIARDTWFAQKGIRALGTKDIDFAVMVSDPSKFTELKQYMITQEGFTESTSNEYVLFDKKGFQIDILPFGSLEIEGKRIIDKEGIVRTDLSGFKEVYEEAVEQVNFENKFTFKVSSLPGIVILKLIAFDDRPEMRTKDIQDIGSILNNYFEIETELIYDRHFDLFEEQTELYEIAARSLGREMQPILNRNLLLKERLLSIFYRNIELLNDSPIGLILTNVLNIPNASVKDAVALLNQIVTGIHDTIGSDYKENNYLSQIAFFRDINSGTFHLDIASPRYPLPPYAVFSKDFSHIKLSGKSSYQFYIIFFVATGEEYKILVTPNPLTSQVDVVRKIPINRCQIRFELEMQGNHDAEKYCRISFQLNNGKN